MVNTTLLLLVQDDLQGLGAILLGTSALANDLDGVDEVGQDGLVDSGQSARTGALLGLVGARGDGALGAGQDAALSNEEDVAVRELLLELAGQTVGGKKIQISPIVPGLGLKKKSRLSRDVVLPLLDLVESLEERDRDEDNNRLLAVADLDLLERVC